MISSIGFNPYSNSTAKNNNKAGFGMTARVSVPVDALDGRTIRTVGDTMRNVLTGNERNFPPELNRVRVVGDPQNPRGVRVEAQIHHADTRNIGPNATGTVAQAAYKGLQEEDEMAEVIVRQLRSVDPIVETDTAKQAAGLAQRLFN